MRGRVPLHLRKWPDGGGATIRRLRTEREAGEMHGDTLAVLALMVGFLYMVAVGVWVRLEDDTQVEIARAKGKLLAGAGAVVGVLFLLMSA
jgi:hypothetical protein